MLDHPGPRNQKYNPTDGSGSQNKICLLRPQILDISPAHPANMTSKRGRATSANMVNDGTNQPYQVLTACDAALCGSALFKDLMASYEYRHSPCAGVTSCNTSDPAACTMTCLTSSGSPKCGVRDVPKDPVDPNLLRLACFLHHMMAAT